MRALDALILIILSALGLWWYAQRNHTLAQPSANTLLVGTNAEFQPFSFIENSKIVGFDIDIITEVAQRLDKKITITDIPFDALIPEIQLGHIHVIAAGMTTTPERAKRILFTRPYFAGDPLVIISPKTAPIDNVSQLTGKEVVVNEGYTSDMYVSDIKDVAILRLSTSLVSEGILALQSKRADAFVVSRSAIQPYFRKFENTSFHVVPIAETEEHYSLAVSKKFPKLLPKIQHTLDAMIEDGTIDELKQKWDLI